MKLFNYLYNRWLFMLHHVECEEFPLVNGRLHIGKFADGGHIRIGKGVIINSGYKANPVGSERTCLVIKGDHALIEIDDRAGMSNVMIAAREHVRIGKDVNIGAGVKIMDTDFHSADPEERLADVNIPSRPVNIGDRCFIGTDAIVLKGVTIGEDAVIGAGAVVTKSVPPREIWGGNPAKLIKAL